MKAITLLTTSCLMVACSFFSLQLQGQTNLVPNGSFEQYTNCPNVFNRSYTPTFWRIVSRIGDAGYFNACDTTNWSGVPIHRLFGIVNFQNARTGNAFIDLVMLSDLGYFQTKLSDSLKPNHYYYGEFYANSPKIRSTEAWQFPIKLKIESTHPELLKEGLTTKNLIQQVYEFSKIYWKSVSHQNLPVTIKYPEMVAQMAPHFVGDDIPLYGKDNLWFL